MILSQTKIFIIFLSAMQLGNMLKILTNNCNGETINYIHSSDLWKNRFYFSMSNEQKNYFHTIDYRNSGQQIIGLMQTMTLTSFVTMHRRKR